MWKVESKPQIFDVCIITFCQERLFKHKPIESHRQFVKEMMSFNKIKVNILVVESGGYLESYTNYLLVMETSCFRNLCPFFLLRTAFVKCPFIYLVCLWIKKVWNYLAVLVDLVRANMLEYMALNHNPRRHCWTLVSLMASSQGVKLIMILYFYLWFKQVKKKSKLKFLVFFKMITQSANIDKVYNYIVCKSTAILF